MNNNNKSQLSTPYKTDFILDVITSKNVTGAASIVLARAWYCNKFLDLLKTNFFQALVTCGFTLDDRILLELEDPTADRPSIIVFEREAKGTRFIRVCKVQLKLIAER